MKKKRQLRLSAEEIKKRVQEAKFHQVDILFWSLGDPAREGKNNF